MPVFLRALLGQAPVNVALSCPPPAPGEPVDPAGFFDPTSVAAAYRAAAAATVVLVILLVVACYLWNTTSVGPRFVRRWWSFGILAVVLAAVTGAAVLALWPAHALAGSCETNPLAFALRLPLALVVNRGLIGLLWGAVLYLLFSILLTRTVGYLPSARNGFFHNRGCPTPRWR
jgi:uncharacterized integral membrane protein